MKSIALLLFASLLGATDQIHWGGKIKHPKDCEKWNLYDKHLVVGSILHCPVFYDPDYQLFIDGLGESRYDELKAAQDAGIEAYRESKEKK